MVTKSLLVQLEQANWIWAKTYATFAPHWYIFEKDNSELFPKLSVLIEKKGEDRRFRNTGKIYRYLVIGQYQYWRIGNILNRAKKDAR